MIKNITVSLILYLLLLSLVIGCDRPQATREEFGEIDVSQEPSQIQCTSNEPIIKKNEDGEFTITPVAEYKIAAIMVSRKRYHDGWRAESKSMRTKSEIA